MKKILFLACSTIMLCSCDFTKSSTETTTDPDAAQIEQTDSTSKPVDSTSANGADNAPEVNE